MTKLASQLPQRFDDNGVEVIADQLVNDPHEQHLIIAVVDCKQTTTDNDTGEIVPTARIRRVEVIQDQVDRETVARLLIGRHDQRTGRDSLFDDIEKQVRNLAGSGVSVSVLRHGSGFLTKESAEQIIKDSGQAPA